MSNSILHKRSSTASAVPGTGSLVVGELAINTADGKVYTKKTDNTVVEISSNNNHTHAASAINSGTLDIARIPTGTTSSTVCIGNDGRLSDARTPTAHTHGNITNAGAIGTTSGLPIITTTSGVLTTGSFGTAANTFCQGNDGRLSDARTPTAHTHAISEVTNLQTTLDGKLSNATNSTQNGYFGDIFLWDDSTPSHYLGITNSANLTAARTLSINVNDANRTVSLSGDLTVSGAATVSGTNSGDQTITLTGDVTGSGTGSFAATLANSGATAGTYRSVTVDAKGRVTAGTNPTTLSGYGITDAASSTHTHGNITNAGAIGSTANLPLITTTSGVVTTGSFGTAANTFCQGNDGRLSDARTPTAHNHSASEITSGTFSTSLIPNLDASKITSGTIDAARLPSYVDDVLEYAAQANFPGTGETGKIYVALDTNKTYRWSGSAYVQITSGAVDSVAGKTGVVTLTKSDVGLGNVDNTADASKSVSSAATWTTARTLSFTGDVTGSGSVNGSANVATAMTIANDAVTYSKIQNVSATDRILGRSSAGAGDIEEITCTAAGRALLDDADATAQRTTLGLGSLATQSGTFSGTSSGTNTGDQTITLTGDVTGSGTGSFAATLANSGVTAGIYAAASITVDAKGRVTSASANTMPKVNNGTLTLNVSGTGLSGSQTFTANQSGNATFTVTSNATSANTVSTLVARDASGNFTAGTVNLDTALFLKSSNAFGTTLQSVASMTGNRTITINPGNNNRTIDLLGNLMVSGAAAVSGDNTGDQTITLTGDVTGSGTGSFAATIGNSTVTYAKIQNVSATDRLLGRSTAGAGVVEEITCTAAARSILDDATVADIRTTLQLGSLATLNGVTTSQIGDNAVTTAKISDNNVTGSKIANNTIPFSKIGKANPSKVIGTPTGIGTQDLQEISLGTGAGGLQMGGLGMDTLQLAASGVTAGTYRSVTVTTAGVVTAGTNPTTLSGYGITDAASSTHTHGNITNAGAIGSTSGLPIITTTSGVLTTGAFGTSAGTFCQGNDARLWESSSSLGIGGDQNGYYSSNVYVASKSGLRTIAAMGNANQHLQILGGGYGYGVVKINDPDGVTSGVGLEINPAYFFIRNYGDFEIFADYNANTDGHLKVESYIESTGGYVKAGTYLEGSTGVRIGSGAISDKTASYTLAADDNGKIITVNSSSATTITVGTAVGAAGFSCTIIQLGTGQVTIAASSTTLNSYNGLKIVGQHGAASIVAYATNTFNVSGNLTT